MEGHAPLSSNLNSLNIVSLSLNTNLTESSGVFSYWLIPSLHVSCLKFDLNSDISNFPFEDSRFALDNSGVLALAENVGWGLLLHCTVEIRGAVSSPDESSLVSVVGVSLRRSSTWWSSEDSESSPL